MQSSGSITSLVVALETSTRTPSIALSKDGELLVRTLSRERAHASDLVPALAELIAEAGVEARELTAVVVGRGPGSYTGLRVGVATALGLARGSGAQLIGVPSGEALAWAELAPGEEGCHLVDVRQGALAIACHRRLVDEVQVLRAPGLIAREEACASIPAGHRIFADEGAAKALSDARELRERMHTDRIPGAAALLELGIRRLSAGRATEADALEPLYLREFQAKPRRR